MLATLPSPTDAPSPSRPGPGAIRLPLPPARQPEWSTADFATLDRLGQVPGPANNAYGFCNWFLNNPATTSDGSQGPLPFPSAPRSSGTFQGNGVNVIYLDWDNELVMVVRWSDTNRSVDQFIGKVLGAIRG